MLQLAEVNWDMLFSIPNLPIVCVFGMATIVATAGAISSAWQKSKKYEYESKLKRDLAAKGYSAEEIERVVQSKFKG